MGTYYILTVFGSDGGKMLEMNSTESISKALTKLRKKLDEKGFTRYKISNALVSISQFHDNVKIGNITTLL